MPVSHGQRRLARELISALEDAPAGARPLREVVARLPALLGADQAAAFLVRGRKVEFCDCAQMPEGIGPAFERWLKTAPRRFDAYDPEEPDPRQRNVALSRADLRALTGGVTPPLGRSFLPRFALGKSDQLRALVCEGSSVLAWVGALRARPFTRPSRDLLNSLLPALRKRLALERMAAEAQRQATEIGTALEEVPAAAFILGATGAVLHANAAARAVLGANRGETEDRLRAAAQRTDVAGVQLARLSPEAGLLLAIVQQDADPAPRVAVARIRWMLTPRQAQVLHLVARGRSNRAIAEELQCAESTVELHVTALLQKSQSASRAHLVSRLWSGAS